jgi:hypothetical protein
LYNRYENISAQAERIKIAVPIIAKRKWSRNATRYRDPVPALSKNPVMNMHSPSTRRFENSQITGKFVSAPRATAQQGGDYCDDDGFSRE